VVRGGGETRRKTVIAFALSFTIALVLLAQPISAMTMILKVPDKTGDVLDSVVNSGGGVGRKCPGCDESMRFFMPPSEYKWVCHTCGFIVPR
jgi:hypothetical protein